MSTQVNTVIDRQLDRFIDRQIVKQVDKLMEGQTKFQDHEDWQELQGAGEMSTQVDTVIDR